MPQVKYALTLEMLENEHILQVKIQILERKISRLIQEQVAKDKIATLKYDLLKLNLELENFKAKFIVSAIDRIFFASRMQNFREILQSSPYKFQLTKQMRMLSGSNSFSSNIAIAVNILNEFQKQYPHEMEEISLKYINYNYWYSENLIKTIQKQSKSSQFFLPTSDNIFEFLTILSQQLVEKIIQNKPDHQLRKTLINAYQQQLDQALEENIKQKGLYGKQGIDQVEHYLGELTHELVKDLRRNAKVLQNQDNPLLIYQQKKSESTSPEIEELMEQCSFEEVKANSGIEGNIITIMALHDFKLFTKLFKDKSKDQIKQMLDSNVFDSPVLTVAFENNANHAFDFLLLHADWEHKSDALCMAIMNGNVIVVKKILDSGFDVNRPYYSNFYGKNKDGLTFLHLTAQLSAIYNRQCDDGKICELLCQAGANVNAPIVPFSYKVKAASQEIFAMCGSGEDQNYYWWQNHSRVVREYFNFNNNVPLNEATLKDALNIKMAETNTGLEEVLENLDKELAKLGKDQYSEPYNSNTAKNYNSRISSGLPPLIYTSGGSVAKVLIKFGAEVENVLQYCYRTIDDFNAYRIPESKRSFVENLVDLAKFIEGSWVSRVATSSSYSSFTEKIASEPKVSAQSLS